MPKKTWFLFLTILIDMIGVGVLIPVIPQLLGEPSSPAFLLGPGQQHLGFILLGFLMAVYPIAMFFASPILGSLSDKYGRRPVLLISILGTSIGYFLFAYAIMTKNIPLLFISRMFDGLTGGNIATVQAAIADQVKIENRAKAFGMIGAAFGLGFILGPFIGGKLADPSLVPWFSATIPFIFAGILALINLASIYFFFSETNEHIDKDRKINFFGAIGNIMKAKKMTEIRHLLIVALLFNAGFAFFTSFFNVYLTTKFNYTPGQIGNFFGYVGMCVVFTQLVIVRFVSKKYDQINILRFAIPATGFALLLYLLPTQAWWIFVIALIFAIPNGIQQANFSALLSKRIDPTKRGEVLGISASVNSIGQSVPPLLAGVIAVIFAPWTPIFIAGLFIISAGILFRFTEKKV